MNDKRRERVANTTVLNESLKKAYSIAGVAAIVLLWQFVSATGLIPNFLLPSPLNVVMAFANNFEEIMGHTGYSLAESISGLFISVALGFALALVMDAYEPLYRALYPLAVITQTIPVVAVAPLLVLWFGYGMAPKIVLIVIVCFFPLAVSVLDGFRSADPDFLNLLKSMGANRRQIYVHAKIPAAVTPFFSGLKVAVSYSVVGAIIAEWLGGSAGLGVYMTRVRKSYAFDKMFAVILLVTVISLLLIALVKLLEKRLAPWKFNLDLRGK